MARESKPRPFLAEWRSAVLASALDSGQKLALIALAEFANSDDGADCFPGVQKVARLASVNERSIRRHLDGLDGQGWFTRWRRKGQQWRLWEYQLTIPKGPDALSDPSSKGPDNMSDASSERIGQLRPKDRTISTEGPDTVSDYPEHYPEHYPEQDPEKNIAIAILGEKQVSEARLLTGYRSSTWYFRQRLRTRYPEHKSKFDQVDADEGYF